MTMAPNLNRKIPASEQLAEIIDYNWVWAEYYTLSEDSAVCWWWRGFSREKPRFDEVFDPGEACFSFVDVSDGVVKFWGEEWWGIYTIHKKKGEQPASRWKQIPNLACALDIKEGLIEKPPEVEGAIREETLLKIFYTLT